MHRSGFTFAGDLVFVYCFSLCRNILDESTFTQSLLIFGLRETSPSRCPLRQSVPDFPTCHTSSRAKPTPQVASSCTEGTLETKAKTPNQLHTGYVPVHIAKEVLLNTLQNLMSEAVSGELVLTAHPRSVILPPASAR